MQQVAEAHIEALGLGLKQYQELKHAMVAVEHQVQYRKAAFEGEELILRTGSMILMHCTHTVSTLLPSTRPNPAVYRSDQMGMYRNSNGSPKTYVAHFYSGLPANFSRDKPDGFLDNLKWSIWFSRFC